MQRIVKYCAMSFGVVLLLIFAIFGFVAATFNPNDYKDVAIKLVKDKKQRTMTIPGTISLKFFPSIGAHLGKVTLSEHGSEQEFASMESASVSVALLPLLKKQLVIDKIEIDGMRAKLVRHADGKMNIDDLLAKEEKTDEKLRFDIDGVRLGDAELSFDDKQAKRKVSLRRINLDVGRIESGVASKLKLALEVQADQPKATAKVNLKTGFLLDIEKQQYSLKGMDLQLDGQALEFSQLNLQAKGDASVKLATAEVLLSDVSLALKGQRAGQDVVAKLVIPTFDANEKDVRADKISASASMSQGKDKFVLALDAPSFKGSRQALSLPKLLVQIEMAQAQAQAKGKLEADLLADLDKMLISSTKVSLNMEGKAGDNAIHANLSSPMQLDIKRNHAALQKLAVDVKLPHPAGHAAGVLAVKADGNLGLDWKAQNVSTQLKGKLDETNFDVKVGVKNFASPLYWFNLVMDKIDLDRYRVNQPVADAAANKPEVPIDLQALAKLQANGSMQVGSIKVANMQMSNLKLELHAQPGKISLAPLSANLYGGSLQGALGANIGKQQQFTIKQNLTGIQIGPLLKDAIKKNPIDGQGNVALDISTEGATLSQWKKAMNGSAKLSLVDGAVSGFNLAKILRDGKSMTGSDANKTGTAAVNDKTDFSERSASLQIKNGVAHNEDLSLKSPLFRVTGNGDINLGSDSLDYLVKPTIVATLQGQGGPELQALKGITVPVRLKGPFTAIAWSIDFGALAKEAAAQKINEKKEEVKGKLTDKLKESFKGLFGK